ncbi:hypothetical protein [Deinococcus roseus]|uniref:Uncharacterized protein n=1 Tax=Deinococcus roseus TaxID=392414 RepID=A0ABQ2DCB2_9DEIO|nr:hypothetical protein [Deinococcus roseus]GGJ52913.1 hypothetical protein GCM10008938_43610 [Deinococcus roseus]
MNPQMHHLELHTSKQDSQLWEPVALGNWIETLTGQQVNVEAVLHQKRHFKVILYVTDEEFTVFRDLLEQHFQVP